MSASPTDSPAVEAGDARLPILQQALSLWRELPGLVSDRVELLALELQRAGRALALILILGLSATLLVMTAWALLWALAVSLLLKIGLALWGALLIAVVVNLAAAALLAWRVMALLPQLNLPKTRSHLSFSPSPRPPAVAPPHDDRAPLNPASGATHEPQPAL